MLVLCRDVFHCLPSQLDEEDYDVIMLLFELYNEELTVRAAKEKARDTHAGARAGKGRRLGRKK